MKETIKNNFKKNKAIVSIVLGILTLALLIGTSTYAYFSISSSNNNTATSATGSLMSAGATSLSNDITKLYMNLSPLAMSEDNIGTKYYATSNSSGTPIVEENAGIGNGMYTLGTTAVASGGTAYNCTYSYDITASTKNPITDGSDEDIKVTFESDSIVGRTITYTLKELLSGTKTLTGVFINVSVGCPQSIKYYSTVENTAQIQDNFAGNSYTLNVTPKSGTNGFKCVANNPKTLSTKKQYQIYRAPMAGTYRIELWGAQGGYGFQTTGANYAGGYGGYTSGDIHLNKGEELYFHVGGRGTRCYCSTSRTCCGANGGYNGGGASYQYTGGNTYYGSGGGSTDVRTSKGTWNDATGLESRIMVAAGGGGASNYQGDSSAGYNFIGGGAGGLLGLIGTYTRSDRVKEIAAPTQIAAGVGYGLFGEGGSHAASGYGPGGGSGYWGGGTSETYTTGGSSYISGHNGCIAITGAGNRTSKCSSATSQSCSVHYSTKQFENTLIIDGSGYMWTTEKSKQIEMPNSIGGYYALGQGNSGDGRARISYISEN